MTVRIEVRGGRLSLRERAAVVAVTTVLDEWVGPAVESPISPAWRRAALREQAGHRRHAAPHHLEDR